MSDHTADALLVECPDCQAPPKIECRGHMGTHLDRQRYADLRSAEHGTCILCDRPLIREHDGTVRHYLPGDLGCPPMADPATDWETYATQVNLGVVAGQPGPENFRPDPVCPDCRQGKHPACTGAAWDDHADEQTTCHCRDLTHLES